MEAAALALNGVVVPDADACRKQTKACILPAPGESSPGRGIAAMEQGDPQGGGALIVFATQTDGNWGFWFATQQDVYHALRLPAEMRVCADGQGVNVRDHADETSTSLGLLKDGTVVTAETFVLTRAESLPRGPSGNGWYSISAPQPGFIRADFLSVTRLPDCSLRDSLTRSGQ